jgi:uncharacterized membrane protein YesL
MKRSKEWSNTVESGFPQPVTGEMKGFLLGRILGRNLFRLVKLNLLFLVFCLPVITAPAATAAMSRVTKSMWKESHFFWSDYWETFLGEFGKASLAGILLYGGGGAAAVGFLFYREMAKQTALLLAPAWICAAVFLLFLVMGAYVFPMIAALDLPLKAVFKNAFLLVFLRFPQNLLLALILGGITGVCFLFFPVSIPFVVLLASSLQSLTGAAIIWPGIEQYVCGGSQ